MTAGRKKEINLFKGEEGRAETRTG